MKLNLSANLTDTDSSESLDVVISGVPVGALLTDGLHVFKPSAPGDNGGIVGAAANTSIDITGWNFSNLTLVPVPDFTGDFQLTVTATATDHATLTTGNVTDSKTVSQTIDIVVAAGPASPPPPPVIGPVPAALFSSATGGAGNDVVFGSSGNDVLTGGGGNDTYQFGHGGGQDRIVNGTAASKVSSGELDFGAGIKANQLWFTRNNDDLSIAVIGSHDQITIAGWYGSAGAQLQEIKTADGMKIDAGVSQLVQAMAAYSSTHAGFDPATATQAPADAGLQNAIAADWHA